MTENEKRLDEVVKALAAQFRKWSRDYYDSRTRNDVYRDALRPFFINPAPFDASGCVDVLRDILRAFDRPMTVYDSVPCTLFNRAREALAAWDECAKPIIPTPALSTNLTKQLRAAADIVWDKPELRDAFLGLAEYFSKVQA